MHYTAAPNLVLESLVYLGLRASNYDQLYLEGRLCSKGCQDLNLFRQRYAPFTALREQLDQQVELPQELLERLFSDLAGFPRNTAGAYSIALLLFAPAASQCSGNLEEFLADMARRTPEQVARDILISFDLSHLLPSTEEGCCALLKEQLPSLPLTKRSRKSFLDAQKNYRSILEETAQCLRPTYAAFEALAPTLQQIALEHAEEIANPNVEAYLWQASGFPLKQGTDYEIRPLLIDPSSNLFLDMADADSSNVIYCGILQSFMRGLLRTAETSKHHLFQCLQLLGDQTRFEIFCYLQDHPAYGQELSDRFGLARNTIHHHMSKLFDAGLVRCMVKGARVYYSIDKEHFSRLLDQQRQLFVDGQS